MRRPDPAMTTDSRRLRCAVYTRKSTEENLDAEFNSLDAQREAAEAYIASQRNEGWVLSPARYDDGGFSRGNLDRPGLRRLLADIEAGRIDCVVVYKVDRLSRSLLDFARIIESFERNGVSFVSVTQQFNTTTSMGRLVLNILLSFTTRVTPALRGWRGLKLLVIAEADIVGRGHSGPSGLERIETTSRMRRLGFWRVTPALRGWRGLKQGRAGRAPTRLLLHLDMDAFFAAIEQRDDTTLRGKPAEAFRRNQLTAGIEWRLAQFLCVGGV